MEVIGEIKDGKFVFDKKINIESEVSKTILEMIKYSGIERYDVNPKNGSSGYFVSTVIPNPKEYHPSVEEMFAEYSVAECFSMKMQGLPLCLRHEDDTFHDVGHVENQFIMGKIQKDYDVISRIYDSTQGIFSISYMIEGGYKDVSLQHCAEYTDYTRRMIRKTPIELSLCKEGKRQGSSVYLLLTRLHKVGEYKYQYGSKDLIYANLANIERFLKRGTIQNFYNKKKLK